ncbi:transcription factor TFIIIB component B'' homolog isoform X2 [Colossoma macropomum]|uniref:transcription factor TFIIIB component B'' homolog isoform X2 n=1 Tax=Colossoma macropomum TaxID=42526 RepID=UPI00186486B9|nr:transcription factor TFIIIB component B'' homolog isoform X2 [Colossoma macropomum]
MRRSQRRTRHHHHSLDKCLSNLSHELEPHKRPTSESEMPSSYVKLSRFDEPGSQQKGAEMLSDKEKILRALKLKALMKIERRKDIKNGKREVRRKPEYTPMDRSKMTMRDLIYYLPNTSPMRGSTVSEENGEEAVVPPSPRLPVKAPELEEEEEEEECEDQDVLVPKVRVAEDGSIVLDEESLTVRVQRNSNTKVVEGSTALFERGSTTTYSSFRSLHYVRSWSVRETDMFYLAISMVGTDFSLIGQLLPHRSRAEIKNKFKKEEKTNGWRIDKAFRNKRPYDREFFSFLLEKVLAKDKEKGKSIKLVMTNPRKRGKARGKKAKQNEEEYLSGSGADEDFDMEDGSYMDTEKENEGLPNVNKADNSFPAKKKRKGTNDISKDKDNEDSEEQGKEKKKSKRAKKTKKAMHSPEGDAKGESGLFNADGGSVNADKDDELDSSISAPKKKRKRSKKAEEERQDETSVERSKGKRSRKSLKVGDNADESIGADEENGIVDDDDSAAATKKRKRSQKSDLKEGRPAKEKKSKKGKKSQKDTVDDEGAAEDIEASVTAEDGEAAKAKKKDTFIPAELMDKPPQRSVRQPKKPRPNLAARRRKEASEPETTDGDEIHESQNENDSTLISEEEVSSLKADKLQQQAVVVLERTPPRVQNLLSLSEVQQESNESEASMNLPASPVTGESSSGPANKDAKSRKSEAQFDC